MQNTKTFIIDFDSTFVTVEILDELAKTALKNNPDASKIAKQISDITKQGMEGKIPFEQSLSRRLKLISLTKKNVEEIIPFVIDRISPSVIRNKDFFTQNAKNIYIISGGFKEIIAPVAKQFGISENHILANSFLYDKDGNVTGIDTKNPLSKSGGKVQAVKQLKLKGDVIVIGDGYTDYEIKKSGAAKTFIAYTETAKRLAVTKVADKVAANFDDVLFQLNLSRAQYFPKSRMNVLLLENIHENAEHAFRKEGYRVECLKTALSEEELIKKIKNISILGIRSKTRITPGVLRNAPKLLAIGAFCIGTNQIDLEACTKQGITVFNAPYSNTRSVVELVAGEIIMLARRAFAKSTQLHSGVWDKGATGCFEIRGKTLGIIGYGNIGSQLSVVMENLGMKVIFYNTSEKLAYGNAQSCNSMQEVLRQADVVTIHVDGKPENKHLINKNTFKHMKNGVLFINASRGFVMDTEALVDALKSGKVAGAAIDVFEKEPKANGETFTNPLQNLPNVILTPHVGAGTQEAQERIAAFVPQRIHEFIDNGATTLSVNMPQLQLPVLQGKNRFIHIHKNIPGVLAKINTILSDHKVNIEGQYLKTTDEIGYVITDVSKSHSTEVIEELKQIPETIKLRILY